MRSAGRLGIRTLLLVVIAAWAFAAAFALGTVSARAAVAPPTTSDAIPLPGPRLEQRRAAPQTSVEAVGETVMCPSCDTTLDQSNAPAAERMRAYVAAGVAAGWTAPEIRDGLVAEYGGDESILATPQRHGLGLLAWIVPGIVALVAIAGGVLLMRRWRADASVKTGQARSAVSSYSQSSAGSSPASEPFREPSPDTPSSERASSSTR